MKLPTTSSLLAIAGGVGLVAGLSLGWALWRPRAIVEGSAPAQRQADSSLILPRVPNPAARPPMQIPRGATTERVAQVTGQVKPDTSWRPDTTEVAMTPGAAPEMRIDSVPVVTCPPLIVNLGLIRLPDQTSRVIAKSPNGVILAGIDIPVSTAAAPRELPWAAGPSYDWSARAWGAGVTRDIGPFRLVGVASYRPPDPGHGRPGGLGGSTGILIRF